VSTSWPVTIRSKPCRSRSVAYAASRAEQLGEDGVLVGDQVDDAVRDDDVVAPVRERQPFCLGLDELDVRGAHLRGRSLRLVNISGVMSIPVTRPSSPTIWAAMSESVPAPAPRSSTRSPS
jgi:hypothetical protein